MQGCKEHFCSSVSGGNFCGYEILVCICWFYVQINRCITPIRLDIVSRNTCCLVEISAVNFMLGWKLLASSRKAVKVSRLCDHFMSISSMNIGHENGLRATDFNNCPSRRPIKMLAYAGAILVPIAVPWTWRKCFPLNSKLLSMRVTAAKIFLTALHLASDVYVPIRTPLNQEEEN